MAKKPLPQSFGALLRQHRLNSGMSAYALAQLCGISDQAIGKLERDLSKPTWETVQKLADALQIDVNNFRVKGR